MTRAKTSKDAVELLWCYHRHPLALLPYTAEKPAQRVESYHATTHAIISMFL